MSPEIHKSDHHSQLFGICISLVIVSQNIYKSRNSNKKSWNTYIAFKSFVVVVRTLNPSDRNIFHI